jgi:hypothetical protein
MFHTEQKRAEMSCPQLEVVTQERAGSKASLEERDKKAVAFSE